jgi:hypothetical protein
LVTTWKTQLIKSPKKGIQESKFAEKTGTNFTLDPHPIITSLSSSRFNHFQRKLHIMEFRVLETRTVKKQQAKQSKAAETLIV